MPADITKYGTSGLKGLKGVNSLPTSEELDQELRRVLTGRRGPSLQNTTSLQSYGYDTPMGQWGSSKYDEQFLNAPQTEGQQQDTRYENQPWYDTFANGVGKMLGTAGTTFISSLVGLPVGAVTAVAEGRWSGLWDNAVTNALGDVDDWLEKNMTNYKSTEQQSNKWWQNLGTMNFWADDVIKNAGFTLGAAASMAVGSGSLGLLSKAFGFVNDVSKGVGWGNKIASALFSATGEGMIEARNGVEERNKLELQKLEDALAPEKQALEEQFNLVNEEYQANKGLSLQRGSDGQLYDPAYEVYKQKMSVLAQQRDELNKKMELGRQQIEESGRDVGNKILAGNQVLLTAGNIIQFSKLMNKSFNNARHAAETTSKMSKPFLTGAERVSNNLADGYKVTGKGIGRLHAATKGILTEGSEEMNQQWIQNTAGYIEQAKDANDYWKAKYNNGAYKDTIEGMYTLGSAISQGFKDSWGDINQWEQFVIGGLTGMAGSYAPTKLFNQDKTKSRWDPRRYGEWSGGAYNEIRDFNKEYNQYAENIDDLNKILAQENFGERTRNLIAHTYFENSKDKALQDNDKKTWKDEDDKQAIHDIQAFLRAGKLDDLRAIYDEMGKDMSDEEIDDVVKRSTQEISAENNKQQFNAQIDAQIAEKQSKINALNTQIDALNNSLGGGVDESNIHQQIHNLQMQVNSEEDEIEKLQEKKASYSGEKTFISPYLDSKGNRIKTNDEIRDEIKHNTSEMSRKLDSYLDSVNAVNEDTRGVLSKDQEDNLAYLHFLGKEKEVRFKKIMADNRPNMPKKFLFKTNKSLEQLTKEYAASDLVFEKNDNTPEGYVEADTSLMDDATFANFFMREIMWGGNISADFGETADEKAAREKESKDSSLSEEERKKRAMERLTAKLKEAEEKHEKEAEEQQVANVKRMKQEFVENYRKNNNATADEALNAFKKLRQAIIDASDLLNEAGEYNRTLSEYMSNPQKVDEDKKKAEDKAAKEINKEEVKGMTVRDLSNRDDLDELLTQAQNEKDIDLINKIKKAKVLREKRAGLDAAENDSSSYEGLDPADKDAAFQILRQQVENDIDDNDTASDHEATAKELADKVADVDEGLISAHIDNHAVVNIDPKTGKKTLSLKKDNINPAEEAQLAQFAAENPEEYEKQRSILADRIRNAIKPIDDKLHKLLSEIDTDDIEDGDAAKMQKYSDQVKEDENLPDIEPEKKNDRNAPVQTVPNKVEVPAEKKPVDGIGEEATLTMDMQQGTENGMQTAFDSGQHPWFSVSGRVGYHSNEPYSAALKKLIDNPATSEQKREQYRKQYKRAVAVEKFLDESGAYTRVENGGAQRRSNVKFKVFKSVNDTAEDFVIFICSVNDKGDITGILGDLPSSDADIDPNTEKRTGLAELYEEARKQFNEAGADELVLKGIESEIDFTYIGKPQYQETRQSVSNLFGNNGFTIALKVVDTGSEAPVAFLDTGKKSLQGKTERDAIKDPLTGSLGQPYVLIPTSQANSRNNFKKGYWAVPIATPSFGEIDKNSIFYRTVRQTLEQIRDGKLSETEAKTKLGELFGVANFHVNFDSAESRKGAGIRATTYIRQDGSEKGAPHTLHVGDRASMDVDAVLNELGRFFINIANSQINSNKAYTTVDGTAYTYNQMIGEIATTNVAKPHTVNDWFTIKPVEKKGDKWEITKTPTQRIPYPSGGENTIFNISIPYQDGTTHLWTISPRDWTVRDEQGRAIYFNDSVHSDAEANMAAIQLARAFGRYYMKDMSRPYVVQVGNQARLFDPTTNTFKTAKELEETPRYKKGVSFNSLEDEYNYLMSFENDMIEGFAQAAAQKAAEKGNSTVTPQQIGQDMVAHMKEMGVDVELVDDANKAAEGIKDAQLLVIGEKGARSLDAAEEATTRMDNLAVANEMEKAGKDALTIKRATGWERGADNKWRYETSDLRIKKDIVVNPNESLNLADIFEDNELFKAYPELGKFKVWFSSDADAMGAAAGASYTKRMVIISPTYLTDGGASEKLKNLTQKFKSYKGEEIEKALELWREAAKKSSIRGAHSKELDDYIDSHPTAKEIVEVGDAIYELQNTMKTRKVFSATPNVESLLNHEVQHLVQGAEGFAKGANFTVAKEYYIGQVIKDAAKKGDIRVLKDKVNSLKQQLKEGDFLTKEQQDDLQKRIYRVEDWINELEIQLEVEHRKKLTDEEVNTIYERFAGEVESRTVQARMGLTAEERRNSLFTDDMYKDVAKEDLIFLENAVDVQLLALGMRGARKLDYAESATERMDNLYTADKMEKEGKDAITIKMATGWERGVDGKWRYEIPDAEINGGALYKALHGNKAARLVDLIHPKDENLKAALKAYPVLNSFIVTFRKKSSNERGSMSFSLREINLNPEAFGISSGFIHPGTTLEVSETLMHEIQHVIQHVEGFEQGSNTENAEKRLNEAHRSRQETLLSTKEKTQKIIDDYRKSDPLIDKLFELRSAKMFGFEYDKSQYEKLLKHYKEVVSADKDFRNLVIQGKKLETLIRDTTTDWDTKVYELYYNTAGEAEARAVATRHILTDEERKKTLLTDTIYKDIAKEDLIFLGDTGDTQLSEAELSDINMLKVDGKILGFEHNGKLYLQKDALNPNLPMHEYTHLWDKVIKSVYPRLWNRGKELMKSEAADLWKQIAEDENYGKRWEKEGKTAEEIEDLIASEVHARLTGKAMEDTHNKYPTSTFAKLKQWMLDVLKKLAKTLGMSDEQVNKLTLQDWTRLTLRDFMEKSITMNTIQEEAQKAINRERAEATVEKIKEDSKNYVLTDAKGNENPQGAYYKDKRTGQLHARVTSVKEGDSRVQPFNETDAKGNPNPWILPSTTIGNAVDEFVRVFFAGEDVEASPLVQNLSEETKKNLREDLQKLKDSLGKWKVVSSGIVASGTVMVKDANGDKVAIRVAGTLDLLLYNPEKDEYAIYDMKTHRGAVDSQKELDWAAQLSLYKQLLETKFPELRGKIKALKIVPFSTSGYDALKQHYEKDSEGRLTNNGETVTVDVKYDGKTIDLTKKEMNLNISFARPGFKKEYVEGEGAQKILVSKPQPKLGEASQVKVKEGLVKTINKIESKDSVKTFLKPAYRDNNEAIKLAETIDKAREDGTLSELCLTQGTMNLLQDMLDTRKIDRIAGFAALAKSGIEAQGDAAPEVEVSEEESIDAIAERKGILNASTKAAWNRLTDENKEKIVKLKRGTNNIKKELKECQRLGKDPNTVIAGYLHRKADETSGYTLINMKKELAWLDRVLPRLSKENKLRVVEGLIKCSDGTWSYGQMKQGLIYLASNGKEGTVYHEAFHAVTQWILTDQELDSLYEAAKERYGNLDTVTLEEKLADDFMRYTMGFEPSYKKRDLNIFQRLWKAIKDMFKKTSMIDKLYRDINDGVYADRVLRTESNEFAHIESSDRQVSMKYNFLDNEQKTRLRDNKVSQQQYEVLSAEEKEYLFHCVL